MSKPELNLVFYPTSTVYIDDNKSFVKALTLNLDKGSYKLFDDPKEGLNYILSLQDRVSSRESLRTVILDVGSGSTQQLPENLSLYKLNSLSRFAEPSVVVADFSMPNLNGLDLCAELSESSIKKILLTGVANDSQAVTALNRKIIDYFVDKNENDLLSRLASVISSLRNRYFTELMPASYREASIKAPFIFDTEFADFFETKCEELGIVEYYYLRKPGGYLMIDKEGNASRLLAFSESQMANEIDLYQSEGLGQECLNLLKNFQYVPAFYSLEGDLDHSKLASWKNNIHPATKIDGDQNYYVSILKRKYKILASYQEYLNMPSSSWH